MHASIAVLPGDGIGPEVTEAALEVVNAVGVRFGHTFDFARRHIGGISIDESGVPLTDETLNACRASAAILLGAVGGPRWDNPAATVRPEQGLLALRKGLRLFANLRPVKPRLELSSSSPLKPELLKNVDLLGLNGLGR